MAERHNAYEALVRQPASSFNHVIEHHGYLGNRSANVDEAQHQKVEKHLSPRRHILARRAGLLKIAFFHAIT